MNITTYKNYIDGKWQDSVSGKIFPDINPANQKQIIGYFQKSNVEDVRKAIESANRAFGIWSKWSPSKRANVLSQAVSLLKEQQNKLAEYLTLEEGKTLKESEAEIKSAIKEMEFQIAQGQRLFGKNSFPENGKSFSYTIRQPLGVVSILSPWNFPVNVPCRKITPALMAGNTVIFKPASFTPLCGLKFVEILNKAGIPDGVLNFITGSGSTIGDEMVANQFIKAVSFTGSNEIGSRINRIASKNMARVQLEMGGKNPTVVLEDADLELAASGVFLAAYSCSGQWCTSTSRVILDKKIANNFIKILIKKARKIRVGDGLNKDTSMGPLAGESQLNRVLEYIELGKKEGARLIFGGKRLKGAQYDRGFFVEPTIFTDVKRNMRIAQEEIFGPVLSIIEADNFSEALSIANGIQYGLSSSIYTKDIFSAMEFIKKTEVGLTHVNLPTSFKEPQLPFGGIKSSGYGLPEAGDTGIEFFTENKSVYINYKK